MGQDVEHACARGLAERLEVARPHLLRIAAAPDVEGLPVGLAVHVQGIVAHEVHRADHVVPRPPVEQVRHAVLAPHEVVGLDAELEPVLADEVAVGVEVVLRPVAVPGVLPDLERLHEAVDVLGHAELLDPALGRGLAVALDVLGREVALGRGALLVGPQVHVVVSQQGAPRRCAGRIARVTLRFSG